MRKFLFLYEGYSERTDKDDMAWVGWFAAIGGKLADTGSRLGVGTSVTHAGAHDLPRGDDALVGYSIVWADDAEAAHEIARSCPAKTGVRVYELSVA